MAKFNVTVDLDWLEEDESIDGELIQGIKNGIINQMVEKYKSKVEEGLDEKISSVILEMQDTINDKLNKLMESFFEDKHDITNEYGTVVKQKQSVSDILKERCDRFLDEKLDSRGNRYDGWGSDGVKTRVEYMIDKYIEKNFQNLVDKQVKVIVEKLKTEVSDAINKQVSENVRKLSGIDDIIKNI